MQHWEYRFCALAILVLLLAGSADARWWIFGKSKAEVDFDYLYLNNVSFDERDATVTLYRDALPDGMANIRGKAKAGGTRIGAVQVSLDNKETWNTASLAENGAFEYHFKPEVGKTYDLHIRMTDTAGKTNDVDRTHKQITLSDRSIIEDVKAVLERLATTYGDKDARGFMANVSEEFAGDDLLLDRAIRKDFSAFDQLELRFTINNVASGPHGRLHATIYYHRFLVSANTGKPFTDQGTTAFVFQEERGKLKLYSMTYPLIFGLSDAGNIATGVVNDPTNTGVIVIDSTGGISVVDFKDAVEQLDDGGQPGGDQQIRTVRLNMFANHSGQGIILSTGEIRAAQGWSLEGTNTLDVAFLEGDYFAINIAGGVSYQQLPDDYDSIDDITSVPDTGYTQAEDCIRVDDNSPGTAVALKLRDGKYAVIYFTDYDFDAENFTATLAFKYKYQPDGTTTF